MTEGQGEGGGVRLSRHATGRLISIKNVSKWKENIEVVHTCISTTVCIHTNIALKCCSYMHIHVHTEV